MKLTYFFIFISFSTFADSNIIGSNVPISKEQLNIAGFKLWDKLSEVKGNIPCNVQSRGLYRDSKGALFKQFIHCLNDYELKGVTNFKVYADPKDYLYKIFMRVKYSIPISIAKFKTDLIEQYGRPDLIAKQTPTFDNKDHDDPVYEFCWGVCHAINVDKDIYWVGETFERVDVDEKAKREQLIISYSRGGRSSGQWLLRTSNSLTSIMLSKEKYELFEQHFVKKAE